MQQQQFMGLLLVLLAGSILGCSVIGPLPTFDEMFQQTEYVITGEIIDGPVFDLQCPNGDGQAPVYTLPKEPTPDEQGIITLNSDINGTAVVNVSCVHKREVTCYTPNGYKTKGVGEVIGEDCFVYVHSIDTVTSCGYFFTPGDQQLTFFMKGDGVVSTDVQNKQCYDSTFALENFVYNSITTENIETCPYKSPTPEYPDCPRSKCFNVVADACCGKDLSEGEMCAVERLALNYQYLGLCGDGVQYFERERSILGQCYCA